MAKVIITTDRTWVGGSRAEKGKQYTVTAEEAKVLIKNGFAEEVKAAPKKKAKKDG